MKKSLLKNNHKFKNLVIPFANEFSHIAPSDLDDIMDWLKDNEFLSEGGIKFKSQFWELFIKRN